MSEKDDRLYELYVEYYGYYSMRQDDGSYLCEEDVHDKAVFAAEVEYEDEQRGVVNE